MNKKDSTYIYIHVTLLFSSEELWGPGPVPVPTEPGIGTVFILITPKCSFTGA